MAQVRKLGPVEVPRQVLDELGVDVEKLDVKVIDAPAHLYDAIRERFPVLGRGELGVLSRGSELHAAGQPYCCVLDDGAARKAAQRLGLNLTGTIGILDGLVRSHHLTTTERDEIVGRLRAAGFRLP